MRRLPLAALLLTFAAPVSAQQNWALPNHPPGAPDPSRVVAGTYKIEPSHTQVVFALDHLGFSLFRGVLSNASGTLVLDPKNVGASKLNVSIPIDSIYTTSKALDEELIGPKFFDVQHWPDATFASTSVVTGTDNWTLVNGNLTIHGQTHPAQMKVRLHGAGASMMGKGQAIGFDARMAINRSEYGIGGGVPLVSDQVQITIGAAFEQQ
jgi:polyisoprenoid-binding protein YceI